MNNRHTRTQIRVPHNPPENQWKDSFSIHMGLWYHEMCLRPLNMSLGVSDRAPIPKLWLSHRNYPLCYNKICTILVNTIPSDCWHNPTRIPPIDCSVRRQIRHTKHHGEHMREPNRLSGPSTESLCLRVRCAVMTCNLWQERGTRWGRFGCAVGI